MSFGQNSTGFGHGPFGSSPFGHGTWLACSAAAALPYREGFGYDVAVVPFENLTEQRVLQSLQRGQTMQVEVADPGAEPEVRSWFLAMGGNERRFVFNEARTGVPYVVRFADPRHVITRTAPRRFSTGLTVEVQRPVTYADQLRQSYPEKWWRLNEPMDAGSVFDAGVSSVGGSDHGMVVQGCSFGVPGLLTNDPARAVACTSAVIMRAGQYIIDDGSGFTFECLVQPQWPPRTFNLQTLTVLWDSTGLIADIQVNSNGHLQVVMSGTAQVAVVGSAAPLTGNRPYHVAYAFVNFGGIGLHTLFVDGVSVNFAGAARLNAGGASAVVSGSLLGNPNSSYYFDGVAQDLAEYPRFLQAAEFAPHVVVVGRT